VLRDYLGGVRAYGARTLADPTSDPLWVFAPNARLFMAIRAKARVELERFLFRQIDGAGHLFTEVKSALTAVVAPYYDAGSLYGSTPDEAYNIDLSANTPTTIADGELHASLVLRMSPPAEDISLVVIPVSVTDSVA
jgi:phage tail sheath protein FI